MNITITISPSEALPADKFVLISARAAESAVSPEQYVLMAILEKLKKEEAA